MIVEIPFVYTVQAIPPRHRNARKEAAVDRLPLRLRTADEGAFPVAFRLIEGRDVPICDEDRQHAHADRIEIRWDGASLYAPWGGGGSLAPEEIERLLVEGRDTPFADIQRLVGRLGRPTIPDRIEGRVVDDNRRDRVAALVERARGIVLCGGRFWEPTSEPVWRIHGLEANRRWPRIEAKRIQPSEMEREAGKLFRADRLDAAIDAVDRALREDGRDEAGIDVDVRGAIEVMIPEAVRLRPDNAQLIQAAQFAIETLRGDLAEASVPFFAAYAGLRDALRANGDGAVGEDLAAAILIMLEAMPDRVHGDMVNWRKQRLGRAFERWRGEALLGLAAGTSKPGDGPAVR